MRSKQEKLPQNTLSTEIHKNQETVRNRKLIVAKGY